MPMSIRGPSALNAPREKRIFKAFAFGLSHIRKYLQSLLDGGADIKENILFLSRTIGPSKLPDGNRAAKRRAVLGTAAASVGAGSCAGRFAGPSLLPEPAALGRLHRAASGVWGVP